MSSQHRVRSASLFAALTLTLAATAHAQDKQACVSAYEEGQQLRKAGKLTSARARLLTCAQEGCPAVLRKDCTVWVAEVEIRELTGVELIRQHDERTGLALW